MIWLRAKEVIAVRRPALMDRIDSFKKQSGRPPGLAVVLVGEDPASQVYVAGKMKACEKVGLFHREVRLSERASLKEVLKEVEKLNAAKDIDGYLVQLPLPKGLDAEKVTHSVDPEKDADGLTPLNLGRLFVNRPLVTPCTPQGVIDMLSHYNIPLEGQKAVVVGRSQIVGKPMAHLLLQQNATVSIVHSKTKSLSEYTREADIVVVAAGQPEFLGKEDFKKGAVVVDVGIHRKDGGLCGDVRSAELEGHVAALSPVPGGVGPMTIQKLLENAVTLAEHRWQVQNGSF